MHHWSGQKGPYRIQGAVKVGEGSEEGQLKTKRSGKYVEKKRDDIKNAHWSLLDPLTKSVQ